jgi:AcrR family transcriptional regulator
VLLDREDIWSYLLARTEVAPAPAPSLGEERRQQIVETSLGLFLKRGYQRTTIREICRACGMSMGGLYYHVVSKEDILRLLVEEMLEAWESFLSRLSSAGPPPETLAVALDGWVRLTDRFQDMFLLTYREFPAFPRAPAERLNRVDTGTVALFQSIIDAGKKEGIFECRDSRLLARSIKELGDTWVLKRWDLRGSYTLEEYIQEHTAMIMKALAPCEKQVGEAWPSAAERRTED